MRRVFSPGSFLLVLLCAVAPASARQLTAYPAATGLDQPLSITQDPSQPNVQIVVEKAGRLRVLQSGVLLSESFLDLTGQVSNDGEKGLLGLAFAPGYAQNGRFFVNYIDLNGNTVVSRFSRAAGDPLRADPASEFPLVWSDGQPFIFQPGPLHKGGHLAFGPDGMLYIGLGDGSSHNDPEHNAQNPTLLLGKILRINVNVLDSDAQGFDVPADNPFVNQEGVRPEIWSFGHRNPWRWTFDDPAHGGTGALIMADVGQDGWEEINYEPAGQGGRNYGWRNREGSHDYIAELPAFSEPLVDPVLEYSHYINETDVRASVTGGVVYRGSALGPGYVGRYFFADFMQSRLWSVRFGVDVGGMAYSYDLQEHTYELGHAAMQVVSFGIDSAGEIYTVALNGTVYRITRATTPAPAIPSPPTPPAPPSIPCATPDPFASMGGGTCYQGGWLPPGMVPPDAPQETPAPVPVTPPTTPVPCATPDPFAGMGGGTCYQGGWLPPGMVPPDAPPGWPVPPVTPPVTTPVTPPATPPTTPVSCATPDPFASMGGGTCYQGGWLPPGMVPPNAPPGWPVPPVTPPVTTPVTPPVTPPTTPVSCATPDPFASMGGGTCYQGGWLPPGMVPPYAPPSSPAPPTTPTAPPAAGICTTPDPFQAIPGLIGQCVGGGWTPVPGVDLRGTVRFSSLEGGGWIIVADDGRAFAPWGGMPTAFQNEGRRVTFRGTLPSDRVSLLGIVIDVISISNVQ